MPAVRKFAEQYVKGLIRSTEFEKIANGQYPILAFSSSFGAAVELQEAGAPIAYSVVVNAPWMSTFYIGIPKNSAPSQRGKTARQPASLQRRAKHLVGDESERVPPREGNEVRRLVSAKLQRYQVHRVQRRVHARTQETATSSRKEIPQLVKKKVTISGESEGHRSLP